MVRHRLPAAATSAGAVGGYSLADAPREARDAAAAVFASPPLMRAPWQSVPSLELIQLLSSTLDVRLEAVSLVSVGPVVSVAEGRVEVVATVDSRRARRRGRHSRGATGCW